jgi:hypothetical protein
LVVLGCAWAVLPGVEMGGEPTLAASQHFFLRRNKADLGRCEITPVLDYHHSASQPFRVQ